MMKSDVKFKDRLKYAVDNTFSKGSGALILWLGILSVVIIGFMAVVVTVFKISPDGEAPLGFWEAFWRNLMRTLDAGTMGGDAGWGFRIAMLIVTIGGVFVISTLIGILSSAIEAKLDDLRKGHSRLLEANHTVILGWTEQIYTIIPEIVSANENQKSSCIAIMSEHDKVEMEESLQGRIGKTGSTHIVCRTGSPMDINDLSIVSINSSRSIIVLSPEESEDPDAEVIKIILAITNHPDRRQEPFHIIAEIRNPRNSEIAKIVGKDELETIQTGEIVARIIAQTCRQSGLSVVYTELMDFGGDEIYIKSFPELVGKTYGEVIPLFNKNCIMGIRKEGNPAQLNPPMDTVLTADDQLVVIAEDDDKIFIDGKTAVHPELIKSLKSDNSKPEKTLLMGWNWKAPSIIRELDNYVSKGSTITIVAETEGVQEILNDLAKELKNQKLTFLEGDITDRKNLESLDLGSFGHIILLCYSDDLAVQKADARTMITLLHLRNIAEKTNQDFSIVSEMLDIRNRNLAEVSQADDFIVSDKLISLMMAQVSENKALNSVFQDIFDTDGSEIYLKPMSEYVEPGKPVNFYTVLESARKKNETAIGYRLLADARNSAQAYGIHLNPDKSEKTIFAANDKIIVLAND
ncbi:MAG: potassium transporter TrkA [Chloroflexi bacterium HGW-Chloroflexi-4]|nr:MAG: potassium transporter TrkA [Chloroflexi bacterium HGW-Chloroflexi-4]